MAEHWYKDPDDTQQFKFDWAPLANGNGDSNWLDQTTSPVETISSVTLSTNSPGPHIDSYSLTDSSTSVTLKISGGTAGNNYPILCQITTSSGQTVSRTAYLHIINR